MPNSMCQLIEICDPIVSSYRNMLSKKAEYTLSTTIPNQLDKLQQIIHDPKIESSYQAEVRDYSISTISEFERQIEECNRANQNKQVDMEAALQMLFGGGNKSAPDGDAKEQSNLSTKDSKIILGKRKRESTSNNSLTLASKDSNVSIELKLAESESDDSKSVEEEAMEVPVIGINLRNNDLSQMLKPVILNLYDTVVLLRQWLVLLIPKVEDGNNFGVEVQELCLTQLKTIEVEMLMLFEEQAAYHLERATILSKISANIEILDYKQYIYEADERHCRKLQDTAYSLRATYNKLYRTITQNYDKITAPRGFSNNHLHLY